ncbi:hypothetical protein AVP42_03191 [Agromyces sp. NDB4Y10]|uniref:hypothetical protein n=1 Tax=Agromyces sp. NDB4Y10 TaxID=1775951 RepID=UPI0007B28EA4|nr:hypothetical protein [Agromyces sp. NDB4Y10]KZE88866.1 hypothetical protein AVP42_03191 [Agromyces sp. NDB4Y10]
MPYNAEPHLRRPSSEALRERIPGWGADLDPADRPSVPRELNLTPEDNGAHWDVPERQPELEPRERSIEHGMLPPVFGTVAPLRGLSGAIRRYAYENYSEARAAHWLLLVLGDRVDAGEQHLRSLASTRPDNPITQTGVLSEGRRHGVASRFGVGRADTAHQWMDPVIVAAPWVVTAIGIGLLVRGARRTASSERVQTE